MVARNGVGRGIAASVLCVMFVASVGRGGPMTPKAAASGSPRILKLELDGTDADFRLTDPVGHQCVMAIDSARCWVPDCTDEKYSDRVGEDHDDSDTTASDTALAENPAYGGGYVTLLDPAPGRWRLEARAGRTCEDSCEVQVTIMDTGEPATDISRTMRVALLSGQSANWRLTLAPRSRRGEKSWARLVLVPGSGRLK
jgi:hypothetical protein